MQFELDGINNLGLSPEFRRQATAARWTGRRSVLLCGIVMAVIPGCSDTAQHDVVRHPIQDRIIRPGGPTAIVTLTAEPKQQQSEALERLRSQIRSASLDGQAGVFVGNPALEFGEITDVVVASHGRLVVLDAMANELRILDEAGTPTQVLGRKGAGPAEFMYPRGLDTDSADRVFVFNGRGRVTVYDTAPDSLAFSHAFDTGAGVFDGCLLGGTMYIHGIKPGEAGLLHSYTLEGKPLRSFGRVYDTDNRIVELQLSRGRIACLDDPGLVLFAPSALPEIHAYEPDGAFAWRVELQDFQPVDIRVNPDGGSSIRIPERGYHASSSLAAPRGAGLALLQVADVQPRVRKERESGRLVSILLDARLPVATVVSDDLPSIVAWNSGRLFGTRKDPFPELLIFKFGDEASLGRR